jgi:hypothetical protein
MYCPLRFASRPLLFTGKVQDRSVLRSLRRQAFFGTKVQGGSTCPNVNIDGNLRPSHCPPVPMPFFVFIAVFIIFGLVTERRRLRAVAAAAHAHAWRIERHYLSELARVDAAADQFILRFAGDAEFAADPLALDDEAVEQAAAVLDALGFNDLAVEPFRAE